MIPMAGFERLVASLRELESHRFRQAWPVVPVSVSMATNNEKYTTSVVPKIAPRISGLFLNGIEIKAEAKPAAASPVGERFAG